MEYEDLRALQRKERNVQKLAEFDSNFYVNLTELIKVSKKRSDQSRSTADIKNLDNVYKVAKDIFERRQMKVLLKSLRDHKTSDISDSTLLSSEKVLYDNVINGLNAQKELFNEILMGGAVSKAEIQAKQPEKSEALNIQLIRITNQVPKIMTKEMKEIGPFEPEELVKLEEQDAQLLLSKNLAELV
jgi:DNA replication initiation complex subunit (GINS family)